MNLYSEVVIAAQLPEKQESLQDALRILVKDVNRSLLIKNRDKFTQNVANFRRTLKYKELTLVPPSEANLQRVKLYLGGKGANARYMTTISKDKMANDMSDLVDGLVGMSMKKF